MQEPVEDVSASKSQYAQFIYLTCQRGAEPALKKEMAKRRPNFRFAYSRPGFITYKLPKPESLRKRLAIDANSLRVIYARSCSHSLGKIGINDARDENGNFDSAVAARRVWTIARETLGDEVVAELDALHVYERDLSDVGVRGFEPGLTESDFRLWTTILDAAPKEARDNLTKNSARLDAPAPIGALCLDVVVVAENEWFVGVHRATDYHSRYPGGLVLPQLPTDAASRAFLKFEEGLRWSDFPIGVDANCVDIGAAPGGGSQALLARGAKVLGVDPAEMAPNLLEHPNFTHLRGKINQLKRKYFRHSRWFITDMNVAPSYTLDALEELVTREDISARGLLFTLKFFDWKFADETPSYISRIKGWGFNVVKARQLQFNRQEIMIAALKKPFRK